jgi:hypothetical protein
MDTDSGEKGSGLRRVGDLEIEQDLPFQRREWIAERVGWAGMALVIVAALLGLFGTGLLGKATAGDTEGVLWIEYDRFGRFVAPSTLVVYLGPGAAPQGVARVWLDRRYLESVQIEQVTPEPDNVVAGLDRLIFVFRVAEPGQPTAVKFYLQTEQFGLLTGRAGLAGGEPLRFRQFIYP